MRAHNMRSLVNAKQYGSLKPLLTPLPLIPYGSSLVYPGCDIKRLETVRNTFSTRPNDILLNSYPKSGNHFLKTCCVEIVRAADKEDTHSLYKTNDIGQDCIPHFEFQFSQLTDSEIKDRLEYTQNANPCLWWFHASVNEISCSDFKLINNAPNITESEAENVLNMKGKTIMIVRNPKDVIVSGYYFWTELAKDIDIPHKEQYTFDDYISYFYRGIMQGGCYFDWTQQWWSLYRILNKVCSGRYDGENEKILWLYYEDLVDNPQENIRKLAKFIGKDEQLNDREYNDICEAIKINNVKKAISENPHSFEMPNLMRTGTNDSWQEIMTEKDSNKVDEMMYFKWAQYGKDIRYYQELMQYKQFQDADLGYHDYNKMPQQ